MALIKPDAVADGKVPEILERLEECGIDVLNQVERVLTQEDAETFYEEHRGTDFFLQLIDYMTRYRKQPIRTRYLGHVPGYQPTSIVCASPRGRTVWC